MILSTTPHDLFLATLWIFGAVVVLCIVTLVVIVCGILKEAEERGDCED